MRIWQTQKDFKETLKDLDDKRLIAQHREAVGLLVMCAGPNPDKWKHNSLRQDFVNHHQFLVDVHDLCVEEMVCRGFHGHKTPIDLAKFPNFIPGDPYVPSDVRIEFDREDLVKRWTEALAAGKKVRWTLRTRPEWFE